MFVGASTSCLFPMLTEKALDRLIEMEIGNIEVFFNSRSETAPEFAKKLKTAADSIGAKIISVHPYTSESEGVSFFGSYPRRFDDEAEEYRRYFEAAGIMDAEIFVFHGARSFLPLEREFYFERFCRLREVAKQHGVTLCQENVARCHSGTTDFISDMRRAIPDVSFVLDTKQARRAKVTPFEMLAAMGENLAHLHISDYTDECECLPSGKGIFDTAAFLKELKRQNYHGAVMTELYRWNFERDEEIAESVLLLKNLIEKL